MSFKEIAFRGISMLNKANQHHQLPASALEFMNLGFKHAVYSVEFSTDRAEHIATLKEIAMKLDISSVLNISTDDPFIAKNLNYEFKNHKNVTVNTNMIIDLSAGNPIFYERSTNAQDSRTGSKLVYDEHIKNAVNRTSGKFKQTGPFITDTTWFQGGAKQGKFREWLFGEEFGLKTIVLLPSAEFDVDEDKTELCMFLGEKDYQGDITVIDYKTKQSFTQDFRSLGYVIKNKDLASILPSIQTETKYDWKRSKITLKLNTQTGDIIDGPPEVKNGKVKVLKKLLLNKKPQYYYTSKKHINDWTDVDEWRFVTGYNAGSTHADFYKILKGIVVPPGVVVPGDMWFTYVVINRKDVKKHKDHLLSQEVQQILKHTRTGKSLHTPQTIWVPYAIEFEGFTDEQKNLLAEL